MSAAANTASHCGKFESIVNCLATLSQPLQGPSPTHLQGECRAAGTEAVAGAVCESLSQTKA